MFNAWWHCWHNVPNKIYALRIGKWKNFIWYTVHSACHSHIVNLLVRAESSLTKGRSHSTDRFCIFIKWFQDKSSNLNKNDNNFFVCLSSPSNQNDELANCVCFGSNYSWYDIWSIAKFTETNWAMWQSCRFCVNLIVRSRLNIFRLIRATVERFTFGPGLNVATENVQQRNHTNSGEERKEEEKQ